MIPKLKINKTLKCKLQIYIHIIELVKLSSHNFSYSTFHIFTLSFILFLYLSSPVSTLIIHPLLFSNRFTYALPIIPSCILQPSIQFVTYYLHLFSNIFPCTFSQTSFVLESFHLSIIPSPLLYSANIKFLH